jgi:hypothetical protein
VYWTFSASAQSISAFAALLLSGYALVHTLMEAARSRDETLEDLHTALQRKYHRWLKVLAWSTGSAVLTSLITVYVNRWAFPLKEWLIGVTAISVVFAVLAGLAFVVFIVNPDRYRKVAQEALEEEKTELGLTGKLANAQEFFVEFTNLERLVREYLRSRELYVPSRGAPRMSYSFRQMIEALRNNEIIDYGMFKELFEINRYRNLVFHGHITEVDRAILDRVQEVTERLRREFEKQTARA